VLNGLKVEPMKVRDTPFFLTLLTGIPFCMTSPSLLRDCRAPKKLNNFPLIFNVHYFVFVIRQTSLAFLRECLVSFLP